jgi:hypothetical protein
VLGGGGVAQAVVEQDSPVVPSVFALGWSVRALCRRGIGMPTRTGVRTPPYPREVRSTQSPRIAVHSGRWYDTQADIVMNQPDSLALGYYVVCLIDVLGQKETLAQWRELPIDGRLAPEHVQGLRKTVGAVLELQRLFKGFFAHVARCTMPEVYAQVSAEQREQYDRFKDCRLGIQQFSDTFVFYAPVLNAHGDVSAIGPYRMLGACAMAMLVSLAGRTPIRGAITIGLATELSEGNLYGPALAEAHHLECEVAKYPRVVVSPTISRFLNDVRLNENGGRVQHLMRKMAVDCLPMIATDDDGHEIVDFAGDTVRQAVSTGAVRRLAIRKAFDFACAETKRFGKAGNMKLAERYQRLQRYMAPRMAIWEDAPGT